MVVGNAKKANSGGASVVVHNACTAPTIPRLASGALRDSMEAPVYNNQHAQVARLISSLDGVDGSIVNALAEFIGSLRNDIGRGPATVR